MVWQDWDALLSVLADGLLTLSRLSDGALEDLETTLIEHPPSKRHCRPFTGFDLPCFGNSYEVTVFVDGTLCQMSFKYSTCFGSTCFLHKERPSVSLTMALFRVWTSLLIRTSWWLVGTLTCPKTIWKSLVDCAMDVIGNKLWLQRVSHMSAWKH